MADNGPSLHGRSAIAVSPWVGNITFLFGLAALVAIRWPHEARSKAAPIAESRKGTLERALLGLMGVGVVVAPLMSITTPWLAGADYRLRPGVYGAGVGFLSAALWLFHRSHADLGANWSV